SRILADPEFREVLACIRCGACLNICPVYGRIGGHAYHSPYSGPIGAVITPWLSNLKEYKHLSYASSLCGACTEVCPVKINLHEQLLYNRNDSVQAGTAKRKEAMVMKGWKMAMLHRKMIDSPSAKTKNKMMKRFVSELWGSRRELPVIAEKSFAQLWAERREGKK
ncbi:MAG TPA: 4Fe-4S dicluster domain-containing protein, partial [Bacteroidales bacterium]|nr:4Fe-4S dicluster domain-containing protein [Bacteroidales bacterium]